MHVFSSTSTELIKKGIVIEGVCMIQTNEANNQIVVLTLKGAILVYKVINPDFPSIDSVRLEFQTNVVQLLKQANAEQQISGGINGSTSKASPTGKIDPIYVKSLKINDLELVDIILTNNCSF